MTDRRSFIVLAACALLAAGGVQAQDDYATVVLNDEPVAYYRFEETEGDFVEDSSGNGHDSLAVINASLGSEGFVGNAAEFFGDGSIELDLQLDPTDPEGDGFGVGLDDFSIEVLLKPTAIAPANIFVAQKDGFGTGRSILLIAANGAQLGSFLGGGNSRSDVVAEPDVWYHFVMTYDGAAAGGTTMRFYVDGEFAGTGTRIAEAADGNWVVGAHKLQDRQFFTGLIDELSVYDYRLDDPDGDDDPTDSLVATHFEAAVGPLEECATLSIACSVTDAVEATLEVEVTLSPERCDCLTVNLKIDGADVGAVDLPGSGWIEVPLPEDCAPGSDHTLEVACSDALKEACTFQCPSGGGPVRDEYVQMVLDDEPVAYYRFEEEGDVFEDSSGNNHQSISSTNATRVRTGFVEQGVAFAGDGSIELDLQMDPADSEGDGIGFGLDDFSAEVLVKPTEIAPANIFLAQQDGLGLGRSVLLVTEPTAALGTFVGGATTTSTVVAEPDTWYHYVMTYDGSAAGGATVRFYVDGQPAGTGTLVAESATGNWIIGSHKNRGQQYFIGVVDELSLYDYRLDDPDGDDDTADSLVEAHFEAAIGPRPPCDTVDVACSVNDELPPVLEVDVTLAPELCDCKTVDFLIDDALVVSDVLVPRDRQFRVPVPEDCVPESNHTLKVVCSGGSEGTCSFQCPADDGGPQRDEYVQLVLQDQPAAYYRFEEEEGDVYTDSSGNDHDSLASLNVAHVRAGIAGRAVRFSGDGSIELDLQLDPADAEGDGPGVGLDDFTIEVFVKPSLATPQTVVVSQMDGFGMGRSVLLITAGTGELGSFLGGGNSRSTVVPVPDTWYHLVMTYDGSGAGGTPIRFYINGLPAGTGVLSAESASGNWVIGAGKTLAGQFLNGDVDELSLYDYRLDDPNGDDDTGDSRVAAHFEAASGGPLPPCGTVDVACSVTGGGLEVSATLSPAGCDCSGLTVLVDGTPVGPVVPGPGGVIELPLPGDCAPGSEHTVEVVCSEGVSGTCPFQCPAVGTTLVRGDSNADGSRNITDGVFVFSFLFTGGEEPPCKDAADTSDQGAINITSGIYILNHLFLGGPPPPAPFPQCGEDETDDNLDCFSFPPCEP